MTDVFVRKYNCKLISLSSKKRIYYKETDTKIFVKAFTDLGAMEKERILQEKASTIVPCPEILDYFVEDGIGYLAMERVQGYTLYDIYGEEATDIPTNIWKQIHSIIYKLYHVNIHYVDITPYNFMVDEKGKVLVIDFGHAYFCKVNWFLKHFLDGENNWNSDFE